MNKRLYILGMALTLVIALALTGCDFAAKSLAKQTQNAAKQMAELQDKAADIEEKAAALSPKDRRAFQAEMERLGIAGSPEWLYGDEAALMTGAPEETGDEGGGGILGLIGGLFGGGGNSGGSSSRGGGTFTMTGIPSQYNGMYMALFCEDDSTPLVGCESVTVPASGNPDMTFTPIRSGRAVINVWTDSNNSPIPYRGNDTLDVWVMVIDQASMTANANAKARVMFESVSFRNGNATKAWRDGEVEER